ncbi:L-lactate permease [Planococcus halotolerans]|uniref:L-lactate permease n=1 Tax=Planococcus halotolerans TaxID=2233542 RepID=A0A365L684_9BACL|nr:L-lactate permease [Planococcus halotolerans]QHJ70348.1 L-lactate permease [Planococcus halotolerans]RAZ80924.1 L-lactate permease [Planococcus halotolerans]
MEHNLPITLVYWLIALLPLAALLVMLVLLRWSASVSGGIALAIALATAFLFYQTPFDAALVGIGKGAWDAFFILLVVWPALLLYQVTDKAGAFKAIRQGIQEYSKNYLFLVLAFGWVFASFLQGIAGFGAPIAVVAPLLIGIGVKPVTAVVIPLIGHAWANMFGTLAVSWLATNNIVDFENPALAALYMAILLWIPNLVGGLMICWLFAKWKGIKEGLWAVLIISLIHGGGQVALTQVNPTLSNFIPTIVALGALFLLAKWNRYSEQTELEEETDILEDTDSESEEESDMSLNQAFLPYYALTILSVLALGIPFIQDFLSQLNFGIPFPGIETGYDFTIAGVDSYSPIEPLTHPGTYLLISSVIAYFWFKSKGAYDKGALSEIRKGVTDNGVSASIAIIAFLTMTQVLEHSGQTTVLALGIGEVSPPVVYVALANLIGITGAFMTSSNTSSNILFSPLHESVVNSMEGLSLAHVLAAQSAGGAIGNAIAPANVVLGTSTAGIKGKDAEVFKPTIVFCLITGLLVSAASIVLHLFFPG